MHKTYTCIVCPNGCEIDVEYENGLLCSCSGHLCKRGKEYVEQEIQDPKRTIASCVLVQGGELPLVSVRLTKPVPRDRIFDVMALIHTLNLQAPVSAGTVVVPDVLGLGSDLIATRTVRKI